MKCIYLNEFLKAHTIESVQSFVVGELNEYATEHATYFFGNGELLVSPVDDQTEEIVYVLDDMGNGPKFVKY